MRIRRGVGRRIRKPRDDDAMNHFLSIFRYCARAHEPAAPRHDMSQGGVQLLLITSPRGPSTATLTPSHLYSAVLQVPSNSSSSSDRPGDRRSAAIGGGGGGGGGAVAASACAGVVACSSSGSSRRGQERKTVENLLTKFNASLLCVRRALCLGFAPWEWHGPRAL